MLASARVFGHVFNPLSLFWCHDAAGELRCVIAEVHNTYGERHCYLLETDDAGRAIVPKAFYVSPFNDVEGQYRMKLPEPGDRLAVSIVLEREGQQPFVASMDGERRDATVRNILAAALAVPLAPLRVSAQIRWQGIKLWARRLPSSNDHTTLHRRQFSDMTEATGSGAARRTNDGRSPLHRPAAARRRRRRHLAQHRHGPLRPQGRRGRPRRRSHLQGRRPPAAAGGPLPRRHRPRQGAAPGHTYPVMTLNRPEAFAARLGDGGLIGLGESYMAGDWDADDLTAVMEVFAARVGTLVPEPLQKLRALYLPRQPRKERNTEQNTRSNISRHYDLSNELFATFLDETMTYSSALFPESGMR